jgi:hypothetical protein
LLKVFKIDPEFTLDELDVMFREYVKKIQEKDRSKLKEEFPEDVSVKIEKTKPEAEVKAKEEERKPEIAEENADQQTTELKTAKKSELKQEKETEPQVKDKTKQEKDMRTAMTPVYKVDQTKSEEKEEISEKQTEAKEKNVTVKEEKKPVVEDEIPENKLEKKVIEKPAPKLKKKKKFPWIVVIGGVLLVGIIAYLIIKKKSDSSEGKYTLKVNKGEGVEGFPETGDYTYEDGTNISYSYSDGTGRQNLKVTLDGIDVAEQGEILMDQNHILTAEIDGGNLLFNSSFEYGTGEHPENWVPNPCGAGAQFIWSDTVSHSGTKSIAIYNPSRSYCSDKWTHTNIISVSKGERYTLYAFILTDKELLPEEEITIRFYEYDINNIELDGAALMRSPLLVDTWNELAFSYEILNEEAKTIKIFLRYRYKNECSLATIYFDDVKLYKTSD